MHYRPAILPRLLMLAAAMLFIAGGAWLPWSHLDGHGVTQVVVSDLGAPGSEPADDDHQDCPVCTAMTAGAAPAAPTTAELILGPGSEVLPIAGAVPPTIDLHHPTARGPPLA